MPCRHLIEHFPYLLSSQPYSLTPLAFTACPQALVRGGCHVLLPPVYCVCSSSGAALVPHAVVGVDAERVYWTRQGNTSVLLVRVCIV